MLTCHNKLISQANKIIMTCCQGAANRTLVNKMIANELPVNQPVVLAPLQHCTPVACCCSASTSAGEQLKINILLKIAVKQV